MQRYFIRLAYDGAHYHGWQIQENARTVQQEITRAIGLIWKIRVNLVGCGRTDTGVHAASYYAHFDLEEKKEPEELKELVFRLNRFLDEDIVILDAFPVEETMHARFSAISRTYKYHVHTRKDPFLDEYSWFVPRQPDLRVMNLGASLLAEASDFTSFSKLHSSAKTNTCRIMQAGWEQQDHRLLFTITADRFLRNMVRAIVGTLMDLGLGRISPDGLKHILEGKDRCLAGESVPARGLFLTGVKYPGIGQ